MQSGATPPPSVTTGVLLELKIITVIFSRIFRMHASAFLKKQAKKAPVIGF